MNIFTRLFAAAGLAMVATSTARAEVHLQAGGATFPAPIYARWETDYQKAHPDVRIDYQAIGSGGGIKGITDKTFDFAGSDAPMSKKEMEAAGGAANIVQIPTVAGAVVLAYNIPGFTGDLKLDGPSLADIYLGNIKKWNDARIVALNAGVSLPDLAITTVHRTDGSGTNYIFTNYLATQSTVFDQKIGKGKQVEWPTGTGGAQNAGVTQVIQTTKGALGYVELAFALQNKIPFATLKNKDGKFVKASAQSVSIAGEGALAAMTTSLAVDIWNQPGAESYPICSFTYIIVYKDLGYLKDANKAQALAGFLRWATTDGQKLAPSLDYAPLSPGVQTKVNAAIGALTWAGKPMPVAK